MLVAFNAIVVWLPDVPFTPVQAPDAVHVVALVADQFNMLVAPLATDAGVALRVSVGAGIPTTAIAADWTLLPPAPLQVKVYVPGAVRLVNGRLPEVAWVPVQAPEAVQLVALVLDHVSVDEPLIDTDVGLAVRATVGAGVGVVPEVSLKK